MGFIQQVFRVTASADRHTFQILTKRHERLQSLAKDLKWAPNIWVGVSVENQYWADCRVPALPKVPTAVRFLSVEPLLKAVDLRAYLHGIRWVIVGGESGPKARPMQPEWVRRIRDDWVEASVHFFFKQWGGRTSKVGRRLLDGCPYDEMPPPQKSLADVRTPPAIERSSVPLAVTPRIVAASIGG